MRKFLTVFLLLVFVFNLAGIFIAFKIQRSLIKNEVMQLLQQPGFEKKLVVITMTSGNKHLFEWEHEKEFHYLGIMYDIVKKEISAAGESVLYCIADKKETQLWTNLVELVKEKNPAHQAIKNLVKLFGSVFVLSEKNIIQLFPLKSFVNISLAHHHNSPDVDVLSPPPKVA